MVAIDTNVAIAYLRDELVLPTTVSLADFVLPTVVIGELLFGAHNSGRPAKNLAYYRNFIDDLEFLMLDKITAEHYAEIRLALKQKGRPMPDNDMWIAAICRASDVPLLTYDRHFTEVPGLALIAI